MTLCPIAIVSGCRKCPIVSACPLKSIIGDYMPAEKSEPADDGAATQEPGGVQAPETPES